MPERRSVGSLAPEPRITPLAPAEATAVLPPVADGGPEATERRPHRRHVGSGRLPVTPDADTTGPRHGAPPDGETARDDR